MPGGDRSGPSGGGPMTGRGAGYCSGSVQPGYTSQGVGRGYGFGGGGRGRGRGRRNWFFAGGVRNRVPGPVGTPAVNSDQEKQMLQQQVQQLQDSLDAMQNRLSELDGNNS